MKLDSRKFWIVVSIEGILYQTAQMMQLFAVLFPTHIHAATILTGAQAIYPMMQALAGVYLGTNVAQDIGHAITGAITARRSEPDA